jgi:hypothetical protein
MRQEIEQDFAILEVEKEIYFRPLRICPRIC